MHRQEPDPLPGRELAAFVTAVREGSVHDAGRVLGLTQSAVTKRIQALERRVGAPLLERGRRGVRPTAVGAALLPEAEAALAALARARVSAQAALAVAGVTLTLAASYTIGEFLLPGWLAAVRAELPGLHAAVEIVNSPRALAAVREDRADVGFVEGLDALGDLESLVLRRDEIVLVVGARHRWARRREVTPSDLRREPFFTREPGSGTRAVAVAALGRLDIELDPALEAASTQGLKRAVVDGGFTFLSRLTLDAELAAGTLRTVPVRGLELRRDLVAVRRPGHRPGSAAERFWRWLHTRVEAG